MKKGEERKEWITKVTHDSVDRLPDGRWKGTIIQRKTPVRKIRWVGLYDKNSDKQYTPRQLIPKSLYEEHFARREENRASKFKKLLDGAKKELII